LRADPPKEEAKKTSSQERECRQLERPKGGEEKKGQDSNYRLDRLVDPGRGFSLEENNLPAKEHLKIAERSTIALQQPNHVLLGERIGL